MVKHFHGFQLDLMNQYLWRGDVRVQLTGKAFAILRYLVEKAGRSVPKEELMEAVWPGIFVQEENLKYYIWELRRALGDDAKNPVFIETQSGRGYRFIAHITDSAPDTPRLASEQTPKLLFGREAELLKLQGWFAEAARGERQIVFIAGEPGIGKTALTETFVRRVACENVRIVTGQCIESYREQEAYYPVLEALGRLRREPGDQQVVELLARYAPTWLVQFPSLVTPALRETLHREILGATRERMLREICEALEAITAETPLVLVLEDLHWADYSTLDFIAALAQRPEPARLMLVITYRPVEIILAQHPLRQLKQELQMRGRCRELPLESLSEATMAEYLASRFPGSPIASDLARILQEQTGGNPLFMVVTVDYLVDRGMISETDGVWKLNAAPDQITSAAPESLQQIIEKQLDRLTAEEQELLAAASVVGVDFSASVVAAATEIDPPRVEDGCESLARRHSMLRSLGIQEPPVGRASGAYQFLHSLYREVIYRRCSPVMKLRLHQRIGDALERQWDGQTAEITSELARHFREGRDYARAIQYLRMSAENAAHRCAYREAVAILESAREVVGKLSTQARGEIEIGVLDQLAAVYDAIGDRVQAVKLYETIAERAAALGQGDVQARALVNLSRELMMIDTLRALEVAEQAAQISSDEGNARVRVNAEIQANFLRMALYGWRRELADAQREGIRRLRGAGESGRAAQHASLFALVQMTTGDHHGAMQTSLECLPLLAQTGDAVSYFAAYWNMGWASMNLGRLGGSLHTLQEAIALAERNGDAFDAAFTRMFLAHLHCEAFDFIGARALCQAFLPFVRQLPSKFVMQRALIISALAETGVGDYDRAEACLSELRELYNRSAVAFSWYWKTPFHCAFSELWLARGEVKAAREEADRLREHSDRNINRGWQAQARQIGARVAIAERDWKRAENEIAEALAMIEGLEVPLVSWRIYQTTAELYEATGRGPEAARYRRLRDATLLDLANSFAQGEPLGQSILLTLRSNQNPTAI